MGGVWSEKRQRTNTSCDEYSSFFSIWRIVRSRWVSAIGGCVNFSGGTTILVFWRHQCPLGRPLALFDHY